VLAVTSWKLFLVISSFLSGWRHRCREVSDLVSIAEA